MWETAEPGPGVLIATAPRRGSSGIASEAGMIRLDLDA
jgi:hypothetical protein